MVIKRSYFQLRSQARVCAPCVCIAQMANNTARNKNACENRRSPDQSDARLLSTNEQYFFFYPAPRPSLVNAYLKQKRKEKALKKIISYSKRNESKNESRERSNDPDNQFSELFGIYIYIYNYRADIYTPFVIFLLPLS